MSGNHRLDDSKSEQERIKGQGFEVSSSRVEGRPCGPLRVWPGGLAMGRTLGDFDVRPHPQHSHKIYTVACFKTRKLEAEKRLLRVSISRSLARLERLGQ